MHKIKPHKSDVPKKIVKMTLYFDLSKNKHKYWNIVD